MKSMQLYLLLLLTNKFKVGVDCIKFGHRINKRVFVTTLKRAISEFFGDKK